LLDHTPDANWGNWAYRILQRPCLVKPRVEYPIQNHITTLECIVWPVVHDALFEHTLKWVPELRNLPLDLAREPWRTGTTPNKRIKVKPYKDSPLWFCAANRVNWDYEYFWLPGHAWTVSDSKKAAVSGFELGRDYPYPAVPPLNIEVDLDALPVVYKWGDTNDKQRPHVWGTAGKDMDVDSARPNGKGKSKGKGNGGGGPKSEKLRNEAWDRHEVKEQSGKGSWRRGRGNFTYTPASAA